MNTRTTIPPSQPMPYASETCCSANSGPVATAARTGPCRSCRRVWTKPVQATSSAQLVVRNTTSSWTSSPAASAEASTQPVPSGGPSRATAVAVVAIGTTTRARPYQRRGTRTRTARLHSARTPARPSTTRVITTAGSSRPTRLARTTNGAVGRSTSHHARATTGWKAIACPTGKDQARKLATGCRRMIPASRRPEPAGDLIAGRWPASRPAPAGSRRRARCGSRWP